MALYQPAKKMYNLARRQQNQKGNNMGYKIYNYRGTEQDLLNLFNELFGNVECRRRKPSWDDHWITVDVPCQESKASIKFKDILDDVKQVIYNEPATIVTFSEMR